MAINGARMLTVVHKLTPTNFDELAKSAEFFLVEVEGFDQKDKVIGALASHFQAEYPRRFAFGKLDPKVVLVDAWWPKRFPTAKTPNAGFYLFHRGKQVAFHPGHVAPDNHDIAMGLLGVFLAASESSFDPLTRKRINAVAGAFEAHLKVIEAPKQPAGSSTKNATVSTDPYSVLGLTPSASNDEVHQAFRKKMAANHPDRVVHLDNADFQAFAEAQVKKVQVAYDAIKKERRLT